MSYSPILLILILSARSFSIQASSGAIDLSYLRSMPRAERILNEIKGTDDLDTYARQTGALRQLQTMVRRMSGDRQVKSYYGGGGGLTPEEKAIINEYASAESIVEDRAKRWSAGNDQRMEEYNRLVTQKYSGDPELRSLLLAQFLGPPARAMFEDIIKKDAEGALQMRESAKAYKKEQARNKELDKQEAERRSEAQWKRFLNRTLPIVAFGLVVTAVSVIMFITGYKRSRQVSNSVFEKTNQYGVVEFETFEESVKTQRTGYFGNEMMKWGLPGMIIGVLIIIIGFA